MGELFNSPHEETPVAAERLTGYVSIHVSQAGSVAPPAAKSRTLARCSA
jgi:hypothetical protein